MREHTEVKAVAEELCDPRELMMHTLAPLASAIQERIGEDVILWARDEKEPYTPAALYMCKFNWKNREIWQHILFYTMPSNDRPHREAKEFLRVALDVAHELGHLLLDRGPGSMPTRIGISKNETADVREVEADWFALCLLQMYGLNLHSPANRTYK